ncbi:MAG: DNA recombination protein RmuC [Bacilli bacterium]|nr:DNA recombination protein RmuC [Bacilli bacterium]
MIEYIIIGLLVIVIILLIILLSRGNNNLIEKLGRLETNNVKELANFNSEITKNMQDNFSKLEEKVDRRLILINEKVNERLDDSFNKTNKTFNSVLERLSRIDEAQKKIDNLSGDIVSLQSILTDKKSRGIFGEVNLKHILVSVFGEKNDKVYRLQHTLPNTTIADAVIFAPEPLGLVAIDSKFPLENYQLMVDKNKSQSERTAYEKQFKADVKKHIDAISSKYIIPGVTSHQAIMFLPAEAIFAEINAYHNDIVEYAYKRNVWITSPTTLISTFTTIQVLLKNIERDKYAKVVHEELTKLGVEFGRYRERWDKLSRSIETVSKDAENLNITTDKITKKFEAISDVNIDDKKYLD